MAETAPGAAELRMDQTSLYREETFTDRRLGVIRVLTPVTKDGSTEVAVERAVKEIQDMRREAASPIIIPDRVPPGLGGFGGPRGSGNIQLP